MNKIKIFLFILIHTYTTKVMSQRLTQDTIQVDRTHKQIDIPYQLTDPVDFKYEYDIQLYYSKNKGKNYEGPLVRIEGHAGKEILAGNRKIIWNYWEESPDFDGKNVRFKIVAAYEPSVLNLKGPEAALYSLLLPGYGNSKVRFYKKNKWQWATTTAATYGLLGAGILLKSSSNNDYKKYENAENASDADRYYTSANKKHQLAIGATVAAGALWLSDIIRVYIKGKKNRTEQKRILEKNKRMDMDWQVSYQPELRSPQIVLKFKF